MIFTLLVDYDNLDYKIKSQSLVYLADKLLHKFSPFEIRQKNVTIRLYGGWYESEKITRKAQNLSVEIAKDFPRIVLLSDNKTNVIVTIELALSLKAIPQTALFNTYRRNGFPSGLQAQDPMTKGCSNANCPVVHVYEFFQKGKCSSCNAIRPENIIFRQEQKLVDTMLTSDMISLGQTEREFSIVSSDDDFWPGILTAATGGAKVYHVHTRQRRTPGHYTKTPLQNYFQKNLD